MFSGRKPVHPPFEASDAWETEMQAGHKPCRAHVRQLSSSTSSSHHHVDVPEA